MMLNFINNHQIDAPSHYVGGRIIEPIDVIESWGLNHHLACSLKYICRAGHKDCEVQDLQKALWYLDRFLRRCVEGTSESYIRIPNDFKILDIALDWELGCELTMALEHLHDSTKHRSTYHVEAAQKFIKNHLKNLNKKTA